MGPAHFVIHYTERLTLLMQDIVARVPTLSFIDMKDVLVFARSGRSDADGAFATCHCLTLPASEPGYYFWRDRSSQRITRRSEWFVTKSPAVTPSSFVLTNNVVNPNTSQQLTVTGLLIDGKKRG